MAARKEKTPESVDGKTITLTVHIGWDSEGDVAIAGSSYSDASASAFIEDVLTEKHRSGTGTIRFVLPRGTQYMNDFGEIAGPIQLK